VTAQTCINKQQGLNWQPKGDTTVVLWAPTWINEFFHPPYTNACPHCTFTEDRNEIQNAKAILYSIPELGYDEAVNHPMLQKAARGDTKLVYMCLEASWEFDCFIHLPPKADDPGSGQHQEKFDLFTGHQMCADIPAMYPLPTPEMMMVPMTKADGHSSEPVSYFSSNCRESRDKWVSELMQHVKVASYGDCLHNKAGDDAGGRTQGFEGAKAQAKMARMGQHLFNIAHEGSVEPYYFSEKLWEPYQAGSVPIYYGPGKDLHFEGILPENSWIDATDTKKFPTVKHLADYLQTLIANPVEYQKYFEWKKKPLPKAFLDSVKFDWKSLACNICNAPGVHA